MICDDDRDTLDLFVYVFKSRYNVISANSGGECIAKFLEEKNLGNQIHLLLLDYRLSDVSGDSVARKIKEYGGTNSDLRIQYRRLTIERIGRESMSNKIREKANPFK